jgi:hypothetical protein
LQPRWLGYPPWIKHTICIIQNAKKAIPRDGLLGVYRKQGPEVRLAYNDGYDSRTLRELLGSVEMNKDRIERAWDEFFD